MAETNSLDTILAGKSGEVKEVKPEVKVEAEAPAEQQPQPEAEQLGEQGDHQKMVPHEALHAEKQKVKRYTEQVASFEQTLRDRDASWERRFNQLLERITPQNQQQPQPVDWFQDPDAALRQGLSQAVTPLEQKFSTLETQIVRLSAIQQHGAEKVLAFENYVKEALARQDPEMVALSAQMRASQDPMSVGLEWFEKRTFDPAAEREKIKAELLKELNVQPQQQQQTPPPAVMPSNLAGARNVGTRSGPQWAGPPPLQDIFKR